MTANRLGQVYSPEQFGLNVNETLEGFLYDRVQHGAAISSGTEYVYFRDIQNKDKADTNMQVSKKLPTGWQMLIWSVGVKIQEGASLSDAKLIMDNAFFQFEVDGRVMLEGPIFCFPAGFGLTGAVTTTSTDTTLTIQSNGVPATNMIRPLSVPIKIDGENTFQAIIKYFDDVTLSAPVYVYVVLYGWIQKPIR